MSAGMTFSTTMTIPSNTCRGTLFWTKNLVLLPCLWQTVVISWWLSHQFRIWDGMSGSLINKRISKGRCICDACSTEFLSLPLMTLSSKSDSAFFNRLPQTDGFIIWLNRCLSRKKATKILMILLPTSWKYHPHKVTNMTMSPTSLLLNILLLSTPLSVSKVCHGVRSVSVMKV